MNYSEFSPPFITDRINETSTGLAVSIYVGDEQWRNAIIIPDNCTVSEFAKGLRFLADWMERKANDGV